ncbi:conserved protein of unknown function [Magnetospirillum sp. XM-1]|uniref:hypothetical protein n=1 Tax=Magnetospirillum sp. XM-1 TaxID=1663591 RepID=UPI00073DC659|nr:hypothetical protein [Magnetospirillum sp. XM-1]CUW39676.1 conserved protein of unknown function [Magnetospirillum sp. XM-1]
MADSPREAALKALFSALQGVPGPTVKRNEREDAKIPSGGLISLRDGDPGDPEVLLSPLQYAYTHRAELVVQVQASASASRDSALDTILRAIGAKLSADPTLGGVVDWATPGAPEIEDEAVEGAAGVKAAMVPVFLEYVSPTPLG